MANFGHIRHLDQNLKYKLAITFAMLV